MKLTPKALLSSLPALFKRNKAAVEALSPVPGFPEQKRLQPKLKKNRTYEVELGQDKLKEAIMMAEDPDNPDRRPYYDMCDVTYGDLRLQATLRQANLDVISEPWVVVHKKSRVINPELGRLFQRQWWEDYNSNILDTEWFGPTLQEMGALKVGPSGLLEFASVNLIPRQLVIPEKGLLRLNGWTELLLPYREAPFNTWLVETGNPKDLGLMKYLSKAVIYKNFAMSDWSRSSEKWADPLLIVRSASNDEDENDKKAEFAENFGKSGWAMFDEADLIELLERKQPDSFKIYLEFINLMNSEMAEGVNGQSGTTDQKSFVGAAEVHERVMAAFTLARLRGLYYTHQETTFPFLIGCNDGETAYSQLNEHEIIPVRLLKAEMNPGGLANDPEQEQKQLEGKPGKPGKKPVPEALLSDLVGR